MDHIVIRGNLSTGFTFVGPFENEEKAVEYRDEHHHDQTWYITTLIGPEDRKGFLTNKFFENAWAGREKDGKYSANYEFVIKAKDASFDLYQELIIRPAKGDGRNYDYIALVPFDTLQPGAFYSTMWHGQIPLNEDEVRFSHGT